MANQIIMTKVKYMANNKQLLENPAVNLNNVISIEQTSRYGNLSDCTTGMLYIIAFHFSGGDKVEWKFDIEKQRVEVYDNLMDWIAVDTI